MDAVDGVDGTGVDESQRLRFNIEHSTLNTERPRKSEGDEADGGDNGVRRLIDVPKGR